MYSRSELARDCKAIGLDGGDVVMVHASVRAVGSLVNGPDDIHLAIKDAITESGTLMMYASCPIYFDDVGRGNLSVEEETELLEKLPAFDAAVARSDRSNGALVEMLRTFPGTLVNNHVARFAVWGGNARQMISDQPWDFAYGSGSALEKLVQLDGKILLIGSDHDNVTFLHYAEHIVDVPDKVIVRYRVPVLENGARVWKPMQEFDTSLGAHASWPDNFFRLIVDDFLASSSNEGAKIGDAQSYLISARALLEYAHGVMQSVATGKPASRPKRS